eukprot:evm.model.scf_3453.2 EVM.evm.TU.scf_3453.2   scf_3453:5826-7514(+)
MEVDQAVEEAPCAPGPAEPAPSAAADAAEISEEATVKLGYKTFASADDCFLYFNNIARNFLQNTDLNEYEFVAARDLLEKAHPEKTEERKVKAVQVHKRKRNGTVVLQFVFSTAGSRSEDIDYVKCINKVFPKPVSDELMKSDNDKLQKLVEAKV